MNHGPVLLHAGIHKTGSTWFQDAFVPTAEGLESPLSRAEMAQWLAFPRIDYEPDQFWDRFGDRFDAVWDRGAVAVVSHEIFAGFPARNGLGAVECALRLRDTFPNARLWVLVREQASLIRSMYSQGVKEGSRRRFRRDVMRTGSGASRSLLGMYMDHASRVRFYRRIFGENARIDLYERLREDNVGMMQEVLDPFGVEVHEVKRTAKRNPSLSGFSLGFLRYANHFLAGPPDREPGIMALKGRRALIRGLEGLDRRLSLKPARPAGDWLDQWVLEEFQQSNRELGRLLNIEPERYGYKTGTAA